MHTKQEKRQKCGKNQEKRTQHKKITKKRYKKTNNITREDTKKKGKETQ